MSGKEKLPLIARALGLALLLGTGGIVARYLVASRLRGLGGDPSALEPALSAIDGAILSGVALIAAGSFWLAFVASRRAAAPVGRLSALAEGSDEAEEGLDVESSEEISRLESSIGRIRRDLDQNRETLAKEREEVAALMGAISEAILAVGRDGAVLFSNRRFMELFPGKSASGGRFWEMFREPEIVRVFHEALEVGKPASTEAGAVDLDGSRRVVALSVSPLHRLGAVDGAIAVFHDVTELRRAEQMRIDFVANVSHELRTPLTAIKGYADTMAQDLESGRALDPAHLAVIRKHSARLGALIDDLLDLSRLDAGSEPVQKTTVDTREATEKVLGQLGQKAAAKKQRISTRFGASGVQADPKQLEQVLVNLVDNAIKYSREGGLIEVVWEASGGAVVLSVEDNGPGIPPEHRARIFERFYRVDKSRSREQGGTGLGLAIVKHILIRHGGEAWVAERLGGGAVFGCRFPG